MFVLALFPLWQEPLTITPRCDPCRTLADAEDWNKRCSALIVDVNGKPVLLKFWDIHGGTGDGKERTDYIQANYPAYIFRRAK